jgi:hypothetical protein
MAAPKPSNDVVPTARVSEQHLGRPGPHSVQHARALPRHGFSELRLETMALKPAVVCALGENPWDA